MNEFFLTIKQDGKRIDVFDKMPITLNTSGNLVAQAEEFVKRQLDDLGIESSTRGIYSWKISRKQHGRYGMVTISKNWKDR